MSLAPDDLLRRLRAAAEARALPTSGAPPAVDCGPPPVDVASRWVAERGLRPGQHSSPSAELLSLLVARWASEKGWPSAPSARSVGRALRAAGMPPMQRNWWRGYAMRQVDADTLWAEVRAAFPDKLGPDGPGREKRRPSRHQRKPPRRTAPRPLVRTASRVALPVLDSMGCAWPSAAIAARLLGVEPHSLRTAMCKGIPCAGRRWRRLTPEEVARIPPEARAGDVVPVCWHSPCPGCLARGPA